MAGVYLIGTDHHYQRPKRLTERERTGIKIMLQDVCQRYGAKAIAEEMSLEALSTRRNVHLTVHNAAVELRLPHLYCDPEQATRRALGIRTPEEIDVLGLVAEEAERLKQESFRRREQYWIERLTDFGFYPLLFICGDDHVEPFERLLAHRAHYPEVLFKRWRPTIETQGAKPA